MTAVDDQQGMPDRDGPRAEGSGPATPDPDRTPVRGVPQVPPVPGAPTTTGGPGTAAPGRDEGAPVNPFAAPSPDRSAASGRPGPRAAGDQPGPYLPHPPVPQPGARPGQPQGQAAAPAPYGQPYPGQPQGGPGPYPPAPHGPVPGVPPHAPVPTAGGDRPRSARKRVLAWTSAGVVAVLLVVAGGVGVTRLLRDDPGSGASGGAVDLGASEFADVQLDVALDHTFSFPVAWELEDVEVPAGGVAQHEDAVQVFIDPQLTVPALDASARVGWEGAIEVEPSMHAVLATTPDGEQVELSRPDHWGLSRQYYIAEYLDRETAEPLAEPRVTAFTVDTQIASPPVSFEVDGKGIGHFAWEEVAGATEYYVLQLEPPYSMNIVGSTEETSWTTVEQDEYLQRDLASEWGVSSQNLAFSTSVYSDDDAQTDPNALTAHRSENVAYGVVAVTKEGVGPLTPLDGAAVAAQLPVSIAHNAEDELGAGDKVVETSEALPPNTAVSMADGRTVVRPLQYDPDRIEESDWIVGEEDDAGNLLWSAHETRYDVPYTVGGTLFEGHFTVKAPDAATAEQWIRAAVDRAAAGRVRTGEGESFSYRRPAPTDLEDADVSRSAPDVPYPVNGSNPLTTYLAANLLDGRQYIGLGDYLVAGSQVTQSGIELWDAFEEAVLQNPLTMATGRIEVGYAAEPQVLVVQYTGWEDDAARRQEQEQLAAEVQRVVADIVSDGMSEEEKARAINAYLTGSAEYDHDALAARDANGTITGHERAWGASGVLLDKTGVCASYAQAFKALADAAGLETVYVTGVATASGEGHAWNKVRIGDTWRIVDATWNDSDPADRYLLLTDAEAAPERTQDSDWVVDSRVADYAAS